MNEIQLCDCILHIARVSFQLSVCTHIDWYSLSLCFGVRLVCSGLPVSTLQTVCVCYWCVRLFFPITEHIYVGFVLARCQSLYLCICVCLRVLTLYGGGIIIIIIRLQYNSSNTFEMSNTHKQHRISTSWAEQRMNERKGEGDRATAGES